MTRQDFEQLEAIVYAALEVPAIDRADALMRLCSGHEHLLQEAQALVSLECKEGFLELPGAAAQTVFRAAAESGQILGAWHLERLIGRGGMGSVYLASRADGRFEGQAAVKVLDVGVPGAAFEERFRREGDILARLIHPNIARLLDAGTTPEGLSYIVMEYVEGHACNDWCQKRSTSIAETVRLFLRICETVQFAHGHLIVHRDLKPSNIIVDVAGEPHLVDFGIARLLDGAVDDNTRTGFRAFSLNYASPEQLLGKPATTADDVYALGVLLYELLTGQPPYRLATMELPEILRFAESPTFAVPSTVEASLSADVDAVVLKAMAPERASRYETAENLAADLRRYLNGFPVRARRQGQWYAARKFVARNRAGVAAAGLATVLALGAAGAITWEAREARRFAAEAVRQRNTAETHRAMAERRGAEAIASAAAETAAKERALRNEATASEEKASALARFHQVRSLARFLVFDLEPAARSVPGATPLRKKMADEAVRYLDTLSGSMQGITTDAELWQDIADAYAVLGSVQGDPSNAFNLGDTQGALRSYQNAVGAAEAVLKLRPNDPEAKRRVAEGLLTLAGQFGAMRDSEGAGAATGNAIRLLAQLSEAAPNDERVLRTRARLAFFQKQFSVYTELSERLLRMHPRDGSLQRYAALGHKYLAAEEIPLAERLRHAERALELDRANLQTKPGDPAARLDLTFDMSMMANIVSHTGDRQGAAKQYREVVAVRRELHDADPANARFTERLAAGLEFLGLELAATGELDKARDAFEEARRIGEALAGKLGAGLDQEIVAGALGGLSETAYAGGDQVTSCRLAGEALRIADAIKLTNGKTFSAPLNDLYIKMQERMSHCAAARR